MPHHSAQQQRQMNAFGGITPPVAANVPLAPTQARQAGFMDFRAGIMSPVPQQQHQQKPPTMLVGTPGTPIATWTPQMAAAAPSPETAPDRIHRVPPADDASSVATKKESASFDSQDVAHSVLLLAAGRPRQVDSKDTDEEEESVQRVPLKKRKITSILRKQQTPCNVSPMSHGSKSLSVAESSSTRTPSYDLKDGQALLDSSKISDTKEIAVAPPAHVIIPHFPSVLHSLLTDSEFSGSVVQWLPHGQSWKIVRWDALRRQVLPTFFPQLGEEDGKRTSGSIDAFLWHLSAWGFEEVTHGPDAGAYANVLFRRGISHLCRDMRFAPPTELTIDSPKASPMAAHRSILQVPSLGSACSETHNRMNMPRDDGRLQNMQLAHRGLVGRLPVMRSWGPEPHGPGPQHYPEHFWMGHPAQHAQHHHHRQQQQQQQMQSHHHHFHQQQQQMQAQQRSMMGSVATAATSYSGASIRSGRGAARLPAPRRLSAATQQQAQPSRPTFSVSNRGKGGNRRVGSPSIPRVNVLAKEEVVVDQKMAPLEQPIAPQEQPVVAVAQKEATTVAIAKTVSVEEAQPAQPQVYSPPKAPTYLSSILKRKLPLALKTPL